MIQAASTRSSMNMGGSNSTLAIGPMSFLRATRELNAVHLKGASE